MTLQLIARDLYRFQQEVDRLEKELAESPPAQTRRPEAETRPGEDRTGSNEADAGRSLGPVIAGKRYKGSSRLQLTAMMVDNSRPKPVYATICPTTQAVFKNT